MRSVLPAASLALFLSTAAFAPAGEGSPPGRLLWSFETGG
jgi:hypothetical protein